MVLDNEGEKKGRCRGKKNGKSRFESRSKRVWVKV